MLSRIKLRKMHKLVKIDENQSRIGGSSILLSSRFRDNF